MAQNTPLKKRTLIALLACAIAIFIGGFIMLHTASQPEIPQAPAETPQPPVDITPALDKLATQFDWNPADPAIIISISEQQLLLVQNGEIRQTYPISSSAYGIGNKAGSNQTPLGTHTISHKFGADAPLG
ncbi:L,D-transpeptidase family protein, partial [candidate division KSB3 bacterium]|nr:L,D-transpeptidase family protein [candidate division KSB3 bacterium]MBD3325867.1 L,D-transpeptidase family protein [candidate division KSB3 bacterium]